MNEYISQFEVPMHNFILDDGFKGIDNLNEELDSLFLRDSFILLEILLKIPLVTILKDEVEVISSFFDIVQLDDIFIITSPQHFDLVLEKFQKFTYVSLWLPLMFYLLMALIAISVLSTLL